MNPEFLIKDFEGRAELIEYFHSHFLSESYIQNNNELKTFVNSKAEACSVRMLVNGAWGFASAKDASSLSELFKKCFSLAKKASLLKKDKTIMKTLPVNKDIIKPVIRTNPFAVSDEEKIKLVKDFNKSFTSPIIKNIETTLNFSHLNNTYMNSLGSNVNQENIYTQLISSIVGGESLANARLIKRAQKGYEFFKQFSFNTEAKLLEAKLARLTKAGNAKPGVYKIIADPLLAGTFFHEAVGHALEADHLREKNTCLSLGESFNNDLTLYDDPTLPYYWGSYTYDSEGVKAKPSLLIKKGRIVNFINDISSYFDVPELEKTANGRSQNPHSLPIPRMSNTVVKPGKYSKDELLEKVKNGLLVTGFSGGAVEPITGVFSFKAEEAFIIKDGKKGKALRGVSLSGDLKELLTKILGIGKEVSDAWEGGMCGKRDQSVPVSDKIPHIAVGDVSVGN